MDGLQVGGRMKEDEEKDMTMLFEGMIDMINHSGLETSHVLAVMSKLIVLLAVNHESKEEFLTHLGFVYDYESFMRPTSAEVH